MAYQSNVTKKLLKLGDFGTEVNRAELSMIGGHFSKNGIGAGYPSRVCLSIAGNGLGEQHPDTIALFRDVTVYNDGPPDLHTHPQRRTIEFAQYWYDKLRPIWQANAHRAHYFTITNELGGSSPEHIKDHIAFEANICQLAHADGLKCAVGKLAGDSPDWNTNLWEELYAPFIVQMWNQYGAIYARHVYGGNLIDSNGRPTNDPPGNPQRAIFEADHLRRLSYGGGMVLAECGIDGGYGVADYGRFRAQALGYEAALRPYADIIIGLCFWECGTSGFEANYTRHLQDLRPLLDTSLPKWEGKEQGEEPMECHPRTPYKRKYLVAPQGITLPDWLKICEAAFPDKNTVSFSYDDAGHAPNVISNTAVLYGIAHDDIQDFIDWYSEHYPQTNLEFAGVTPPPPQWTKLPIPHLSQYGPGADARANDCGAAAAAMVIRGMTSNAPSVDNIAIAYQTTPNAYMNFTHIDNALNGYGMDGTRRQPYTPEQISTTIASGKPVIALAWYQSLPRKFSTFNGSHFIPIYGTDKNGRLLYRDPLAPTGFSEELIITYAQLNAAMSGVTAEGNQPNQAMDCVKKNEPSQTVDMLQYFKPASGAYGQVTIKDTNWGQGQVRQQVQAHGDYLYVTKGVEFEARRLSGDRIFFVMDDSPGDGKYYVVQSNDGWIPRYFTKGQSFTRKETATFYYKNNCNATGEASSWTNVIKFTEFYPTWQNPAGLPFSNVSHLQWILNGVIEEDYYLAPGVGYALWKNRHGRQSHIVEMPQGQGNNVFRGACYWPAFGKEWP